ncbi:lamin tail domain-containing protein [Myxococcaceae bacterium GXIMD 01537]
MSFVQKLGALAVLAALCACSGEEPGENPKGPRLPQVELPSTTEGRPYTAELAAQGGVAPLRYSVTGLPPGFSFYNGTGQLTGPATTSGDFALAVVVKDAQGQEGARAYSLKVWPAPAITTEAVPGSIAGEGYSFTLSAIGGQAPLSWNVVGGALPPGFALSEEGVLSGTSHSEGPYAFKVRVREANGAEAEREFALTLLPPPDGGPGGDGGTTDGGTDTDGGTTTDGGTGNDGGTTDGGTGSDGGTTTDGGTGTDGGTTTDGGTGTDGGTTTDGGTGNDGGTQGPDAGAPMPLAVANWNMEWFGELTQGPTNEQLQFDNAKTVLTTTGADIYALEEVVDSAVFSQLKAELTGYDGFLSNDSSRVAAGSSYYTAFEQKLGVLYKSSVVSVRRAEVVLTGSSSTFAGRPPLRLDLRVTRNGASEDFVAIVLHLKAFSDSTSYTARQNASIALKDYIDTQLPNERVLVLGDWNDDIDSSISGGVSPFDNFLSDAANYTYLTDPLKSTRSTVNGSAFIDHQLASSEMMPVYVPNSTTVVKPSITNYGNTTSDHYPILSRFDFAQVTSLVKVTAPNGGEVLTGGTTFDITWNFAGISHVRVDYSLDNGANWTQLTASTPASNGHYLWQVPSTATGSARVRVRDANNASFFDDSDATFTIVKSAPSVIINEILAHEPPVPSSTERDYAQEFVEIRNTGSTTVDLSGWQVNDKRAYDKLATTRHTFASGTTLAPGKVLVVFSGASALGTHPNALAAIPGPLFLDNGPAGDTVYLQDSTGQVIDSYAYTSTTERFSFNRSPDGSSAGTFVLHPNLPPGYASTPGLRSDNTSF